MLRFLWRRFLAGLATLLVALFIMYLLVNKAIDPLADLRESTAPNKAQLIEQRIAQLDLNTNVVLRFFSWLGQVATGDLGTQWRTGRDVLDLVGSAIVSTLQLVTASTLIALVLGIAVGVVSALRQYSSFDYGIIFLSFFLYSLPSFFVAVLLKQWGAIGFNDFLRDPTISTVAIVVLTLLGALVWSLAVGGSPRRRLQTALVAGAATGGLLVYLQATGWWDTPRIDPVLLTVFGLAAAAGLTLVSAGLQNRRALASALVMVVLGLVLQQLMGPVFDAVAPSNLSLAALVVVFVAIGWGVGVLLAGPDRGVSARTGALTALVMVLLVVIDRVMQVWPPYFEVLRGRPIPTIGDRTPNLGGNYWVGLLDSYTHLVLPTISLILISFAAYTRYSRGSMLEVMNQDYIRTARAKGLPERVVVVRHGFRNTLIPLATVVPIDVITLIGGAIITENIFGRPGMGRLFVENLQQADIEPVMAYLLITATLAIVANVVADLVYAVVDPRIRLDA
ncbi:ABC transporter permease [Cellulomonas endophytica]|uniref:ABC transporter permease n=1 Tax=Cellulomonas endophytica TaxID=2494735 RepID=UPI001012FD14|nr:ABC transporter permease [Cellulomonas endophytica]